MPRPYELFSYQAYHALLIIYRLLLTPRPWMNTWLRSGFYSSSYVLSLKGCGMSHLYIFSCSLVQFLHMGTQKRLSLNNAGSLMQTK
jgi:hypothetical protein